MARLAKSSYIKISLVTLLCLTACTAVSGGFLLVNKMIGQWFNPLNTGRSWVMGEGAATGNFTVDAATVNDISINWAAGSVTVKVVDDAETNGLIQVNEPERSRPSLCWRQTGEKLEIDYGNFSGLFACSSLHFGKELTVLIPKSRCDKLNSFDLDAATGKYDLSGIECKKLDLNLASGDARFDDLDTESFTANIASGTLSYDGEVTDMLNIDQASGRCTIHLNGSNPLNSKLSLASGDMNLQLPRSGFRLELTKLSGIFQSDYELFSKGDTYYSMADGTPEEHFDPNSVGNHDTSDASTDANHDDIQSKISMNMMSGRFTIGKSR